MAIFAFQSLFQQQGCLSSYKKLQIVAFKNISFKVQGF